MKKILLFLIVLLMIPAVFADITITTDQDIYNLGDKMAVSASVLSGKNFDGLFKLALSCGTYNLQYFLTPVSLEANFRSAVEVPQLTATSSMLGNCAITGDLTTNDNLAVEEKSSNNFEITKQLIVLPIKTKITSLPDTKILIAGVVNGAFGSNVIKSSVKIELDNESHLIEATDGKFNVTIDIAKNIKSGKHSIDISASDSKSNRGYGTIELEITAVPSYIKNDLSSDSILPGSKIEITSSLYDQADELINATLDLELKGPKSDKIFRKTAQSNQKLQYEFSQYAEPGIYLLHSTYNGLITESSINISTVREVKINYENENVFIENIGNIPFEDDFTFILENEAKKYPITKKLKIEAGKILGIDLSKEVPLGIYNILAPLKDGLAPLKDKLNETIGLFLGNESVLASEVTIHDNRPIYKKIASGISSITGTLVGADGILSKNPIVAPLLLGAIILIIVVRYGRKPIMKLFKKKNDEEKH